MQSWSPLFAVAGRDSAALDPIAASSRVAMAEAAATLVQEPTTSFDLRSAAFKLLAWHADACAAPLALEHE